MENKNRNYALNNFLNKNNIFNENIVDVILITIMSFLSMKNIYSNQIVSKRWRNILISKLFKKICRLKVPTNFEYFKKYEVDFNIENLSYINGKFFVSGKFSPFNYVYDFTDKKMLMISQLSHLIQNIYFLLILIVIMILHVTFIFLHWDLKKLEH